MAEVVLEKANLTKIENNLKSIETEINQQTNAINKVSDDVKNVSNELCQLKDEFEKMINEQRKTAALQQATTELVRVRQELEQEYGNYRVVRETMLGVLQATDSALVREKTIARVSEELMLSTPKYWLAPVLVAVSAWISNDHHQLLESPRLISMQLCGWNGPQSPLLKESGRPSCPGTLALGTEPALGCVSLR